MLPRPHTAGAHANVLELPTRGPTSALPGSTGPSPSAPRPVLAAPSPTGMRRRAQPGRSLSSSRRHAARDRVGDQAQLRGGAVLAAAGQADAPGSNRRARPLRRLCGSLAQTSPYRPKGPRRPCGVSESMPMRLRSCSPGRWPTRSPRAAASARDAVSQRRQPRTRDVTQDVEQPRSIRLSTTVDEDAAQSLPARSRT
jgi:hypothetical protein